MPDFRPCSTCRSHSQAPLCQCTLQVISIHLEGTFGRLRYLLGGDRPSQTAHLAGSSIFVELGPKLQKSGISRSTPQTLACLLQSLPPILHIYNPSPMPSYSKAPRGLFVLPRVARVFTGTAISPSPSSRQWPSRSTIHAGRNLPDKGLRYLRHVVTHLFSSFYQSIKLMLGGAGHFCRPLHVAIQIGPYLPTGSDRGLAYGL